MKIAMKEKINKQWGYIDIKRLKGHAPVHYIAEQFAPSAIAVYDEEDKDPTFFIVNTQEVYDAMKAKGSIVYMAQDFICIMEDNPFHSLIAQELGGNIYEIKKAEPEPEAHG